MRAPRRLGRDVKPLRAGSGLAEGNPFKGRPAGCKGRPADFRGRAAGFEGRPAGLAAPAVSVPQDLSGGETTSERLVRVQPGSRWFIGRRRFLEGAGTQG